MYVTGTAVAFVYHSPYIVAVPSTPTTDSYKHPRHRFCTQRNLPMNDASGYGGGAGGFGGGFSMHGMGGGGGRAGMGQGGGGGGGGQMVREEQHTFKTEC